VPDGQAGIFVSPNSALALKDAILLLLKDDELRETMGNTGQTYALANYSASVVAEAHENLYRSVLDGKV